MEGIVRNYDVTCYQLFFRPHYVLRFWFWYCLNHSALLFEYNIIIQIHINYWLRCSTTYAQNCYIYVLLFKVLPSHRSRPHHTKKISGFTFSFVLCPYWFVTVSTYVSIRSKFESNHHVPEDVERIWKLIVQFAPQRSNQGDYNF